jgi:hypothetical protein
LLLSVERQVLLNCSRQSGKSRAVSALALLTTLFTPGALILLLSPSLRQSVELFRKVMEGYNPIRRPRACGSRTAACSSSGRGPAPRKAGS